MNRTLFRIFASLSIAWGIAETGSGGGIDGVPNPLFIDWVDPPRTTEIAISGTRAQVRTRAPDGRFLVGWEARVQVEEGRVKILSAGARPTGPLSADYDPDDFTLLPDGKVEISDRRGRRHVALARAATGGDAAIALVRRALEEHRAYPPEQMRLLMFFADPAEDGSVEVSARWNNRKIPGADPDVAPMAAMFRVGRDRKTIEWLDVLEGDYRPFARFLERRREP